MWHEPVLLPLRFVQSALNIPVHTIGGYLRCCRFLRLEGKDNVLALQSPVADIQRKANMLLL